ncbi:MAG: beta-galactosidase, partial [Paracoccaceae bacterium]
MFIRFNKVRPARFEETPAQSSPRPPPGSGANLPSLPVARDAMVDAMTLELGVCYYPEQCERGHWREDARRMADLGLDWVRLAEFSWASVERRRGCFTWDWLDEVIGILGEAGLKVMMCTPTAAPPKWLVDEHPDILPVGPDGRTRGFGARRHYCFSSRTYLAEACRIATEYARRYGQNPHVQAWQIDNEYG